MKRTVQNRPSKASLVARGLAAKPLKGKRVLKSKKVPDNRPGYSLYSTDSEDQASTVGRGLDRCAALLTNILDNNNKGTNDKRGTENKPILKQRGKSTPSGKTFPAKSQASSSVGKPIIIPTASQKDQGPSTLYNERLVASTPLLNPGERKKQQHLLEREQELTHQLLQLQQHYDLLQRQKSPEIQEQQKRSLQDSMLHELDDYQTNEPDERSPRSTKGTPTSRRSLDYNHTGINTRHSYQSPEHDEQETSHSSTLRSSLQQDKRFMSEQSDNIGIKKQVRMISPASSERYHPRTASYTSPRRSDGTHNVSHKTGETVSPAAASNEVRTLQYLMRELREVIGNHDDLEVNRLIMEIDHTCSLLPYLIPPRSPNQEQDEDLDTKRLRLENAFLKRKLQGATEKTEHQALALHNYQQLQSGQTSVTYELASCRSENASLQKRLKEEKQENEKLHRELRNFEKVIEDLREEKRKFIQILENKDQTHSKNRRSTQLETLKFSNEIKQLKAEVEASKLSLEAARKESVIVNLSLKQKDAEIERLNELTKALNQTMRRALGEMQEFTPNRSNGAIKQPITTPLEASLIRSYIPSLSEPRIIPSLNQPSTSITDSDMIGLEALQDHRLSSLFEASINKGPMINNQRSLGSAERDSYHHRQRPTISPYITRNKSPNISIEDPVCFSPKASLGKGAWDEGGFAKDRSLELSPFSSGDEEDFQRDLANLDADIARIQRSLRETAKRS